jgi:hypothetical protein
MSSLIQGQLNLFATSARALETSPFLETLPTNDQHFLWLQIFGNWVNRNKLG